MAHSLFVGQLLELLDRSTPGPMPAAGSEQTAAALASAAELNKLATTVQSLPGGKSEIAAFLRWAGYVPPPP